VSWKNKRLDLAIGQEIWLFGHADWSLTLEAIDKKSMSPKAKILVNLSDLDVQQAEEFVEEACNADMEEPGFH
jgi:hypothetical protein